MSAFVHVGSLGDRIRRNMKLKGCGCHFALHSREERMQAYPHSQLTGVKKVLLVFTWCVLFTRVVSLEAVKWQMTHPLCSLIARRQGKTFIYIFFAYYFLNTKVYWKWDCVMLLLQLLSPVLLWSSLSRLTRFSFLRWHKHYSVAFWLQFFTTHISERMMTTSRGNVSWEMCVCFSRMTVMIILMLFSFVVSCVQLLSWFPHRYLLLCWWSWSCESLAWMMKMMMMLVNDVLEASVQSFSSSSHIVSSSFCSWFFFSSLPTVQLSLSFQVDHVRETRRRGKEKEDE